MSYSYTELDRLATVTDWAGGTTGYSYDDAGRVTAISFPTSVSASYTNDAAGRLRSLAYSRSGSTLASFDYTLSASGQRLTEAGPEGTTGYSYDALHRLASVSYPDSTVEAFSYDAVGNRLSRSLGAQTTSYSYDGADQLTSVTLGADTTTFSYDANGNRASRTTPGPSGITTSYSYDAENRLTSVAEGVATLASYGYDGDGNRHAKTVGGTTLSYTLDLVGELSQVLAESDGTGYLYGADLLAMERHGALNWYLPDGLGSTRRVTDSSGALSASYTYQAFGAVRSATGTLANEVRFTGERSDPETDLQFLRARHYDPVVGRFLQPDSWAYDETISGDLNRYSYVRNDPVNAIDPSGHFLDIFVWTSCRWRST